MSSVTHTTSKQSEREGSISIKEVLQVAPDAMSEVSMDIVSNLLNHKDKATRREEKEDSDECPSPSPKPIKMKTDNVDLVTHYFTRRKIGDLMLFMMQHLLINEPDDPVEFLQQLMDKCLMFRSGILCSAPLLFEDRHVLSLYNSLDPLCTGSISRKQYHVGMQTLGLKRNQYEMEPEIQCDGSISKQTFLSNAKMALVENFMDMILLPPPMEDGDSSLETFYH